ncbi:MAG: RecX family transcriptional regulator [Treponema sp.]|jgi:regulatory protein|nr:RecX family transcriptional regulator [Treponema sp.]
MTLVSIKTGTEAELKRIALSDGSLFSLRTCYLTGASAGGGSADDLSAGFIDGLAGGEEISAGEEGAFRFAAACLRAERAALRLAARAEQTVSGLSRKLERRGFKSPCVLAVLRRLADLDIVNDRRFAALWIQARLTRRAESPWRLLAGLRNRGIDRDDAAAALKSALNFQTESALLRRYVEKLYPVSGPEAAEGSSLKYRLKREGFSPLAIQNYWEEREW